MGCGAGALQVLQPRQRFAGVVIADVAAQAGRQRAAVRRVVDARALLRRHRQPREIVGHQRLARQAGLLRHHASQRVRAQVSVVGALRAATASAQAAQVGRHRRRGRRRCRARWRRRRGGSACRIATVRLAAICIAPIRSAAIRSAASVGRERRRASRVHFGGELEQMQAEARAPALGQAARTHRPRRHQKTQELAPRPALARGQGHRLHVQRAPRRRVRARLRRHARMRDLHVRRALHRHARLQLQVVPEAGLAHLGAPAHHHAAGDGRTDRIRVRATNACARSVRQRRGADHAQARRGAQWRHDGGMRRIASPATVWGRPGSAAWYRA